MLNSGGIGLGKVRGEGREEVKNGEMKVAGDIRVQYF